MARHLIVLDLRDAGVAALARDDSRYRDAIADARTQLTASFAADEPAVQSALKQLDALHAAALAPAVRKSLVHPSRSCAICVRRMHCEPCLFAIQCGAHGASYSRNRPRRAAQIRASPMKLWATFLGLLVVACAAAFGWQFLATDPGYVLIHIGSTRIETSVVFAVVDSCCSRSGC